MAHVYNLVQDLTDAAERAAAEDHFNPLEHGVRLGALLEAAQAGGYLAGTATLRDALSDAAPVIRAGGGHSGAHGVLVADEGEDEEVPVWGGELLDEEEDAEEGDGKEAE